MVAWDAKANDVFLRAVEIAPPPERLAYLNEACAGDDDLRAAVQELLDANDKAGSFLEAPLCAAATTQQLDPIVEEAGNVVGSYKLLEQIGEGGMGLVFMAEQQEPIRRRVALKLIKPGMDTRHVIARFEAERQALALMDHPNIAKVLDAGTTQSGRPYFVMELVRGIPITEYCDRAKLPAAERLGLFVSVCQAVQHAHQKGIIHRDIKPSNVLVTLHDGTPVPKVIDFGIAKAINQQLTERTLFTQFAQVIGTPQYMSPEQAELSGLDIDTRADVYSLGVLLYELLTGTTPIEKKRLESASYDEICRIIREEDPPRPSSRLETLGQALTTVSAQRGVAPQKLSLLVRGELDWITMKALEKDRTRRYETSSTLAADVQRFLNDEPVTACPPSRWYQLRRLARRNKLAITTAALIAAALLVGTGVSLWQAVRATRARQFADDRTRQSQASLHSALDAVERMLMRTGEEGMRQSPKLAKVWAGFYDDASAICQKLIDQEARDPVARYTTARAYYLVADIQWRVGNLAEAGQACHRAIELGQQLVAAFPDATPYEYHLANAYQLLGYRLMMPTHEMENAERALGQALTIWRKQRDRLPEDVAVQSRLSHCLENLGYCQWSADRLDGAQASYREALSVLEQLMVAAPLEEGHWSQKSYVSTSLGLLLRTAGRLREAEQLFRQGLLDLERCSSQRDGPARGAFHLGIVLWQLGQASEAEERFRQAVRLWEAYDNRPESALAYRSLGQFLSSIGPLEEAEEAFHKSGTLQQGLIVEFPKLTRYPLELATGWRLLGNLLRDTGRFDEAEKRYRQALDLQTKWIADAQATSSDRLEMALTHNDYANLLAAMGRTAESQKMFRAAKDAFQQAMDSAKPGQFAVRHALARFLASCPDLSVRDATHAVELAKAVVQQAPEIGRHWSTLGLAHYRASSWQPALEALEKANGLLCGHENALNQFMLGMAHWQLDHKTEAKAWHEKAAHWMQMNKRGDIELRRIRAEAEELMRKNP